MFTLPMGERVETLMAFTDEDDAVGLLAAVLDAGPSALDPPSQPWTNGCRDGQSRSGAEARARRQCRCGDHLWPRSCPVRHRHHARPQPFVSGFAALGVLALGAFVGIIALPVFAAALSLLMLRGSGMYRLCGWLLLVFVGGMAWVGAVIVITGGS